MQVGSHGATMKTPITATALLSIFLVASTGVPLAGATGPAIQPGIEIISGGAQCTLAWIFDDVSTGEVFAATAAHCVNGVGATVRHRSGPTIGTVDWESPTLDFVLIKINDTRHHDVDGELLGHAGTPTRVATLADTSGPSVCQFSGYGTGYRYTAPTREQRAGLLTHNDGRQHYCQFPVTPGDSGGPVALLGGPALGIVNTVGVACCPSLLVHAGEGGASLQWALIEAAADGYDLAIRTA